MFLKLTEQTDQQKADSCAVKSLDLNNWLSVGVPLSPCFSNPVLNLLQAKRSHRMTVG